MQYKIGQFVGNHGLSYTITNLTMVAIWRSNGFRIHPLTAEKKTTLLFQGTFGHTVFKGLWFLGKKISFGNTWQGVSTAIRPGLG